MQLKLILAISISIIMVGLASWERFIASSQTKIDVETVPQANLGNQYEDSLLELVKSRSGGAPSVTESEPTYPNTATDMISRQLLSDYFSMSVNGEMSDEALENLASSYVEKVPTLHNPDTINYTDVVTNSNTKDNFQKYSDTLTEIYNEYLMSVSEVWRENDATNPKYSSALSLSLAYNKAFTELKKIPAPTALAIMHFQLINTYISNAEALLAISNTEKDPTLAIAGMVALNENLVKEKIILNEINRILSLNDV